MIQKMSPGKQERIIRAFYSLSIAIAELSGSSDPRAEHGIDLFKLGQCTSDIENLVANIGFELNLWQDVQKYKNKIIREEEAVSE